MKIDTTVFGPQEIDPKSIIEFPDGIPGFDEFKQFKLFHHEENQDLFWLQSTEQADVAFSVMDPERLGVFFEFTLSPEELKLLETESPDDIALLVMIYEPIEETKEKEESESPIDPAFINANVRGPIVINTALNKGLQKVIQNYQQKTTISEI